MKLCIFCDHKLTNNGWSCPQCHLTPPNINAFLSFAPNLEKENIGFKEHYFSELFQVEKNNFWFCARNKLILWALKKYFPFSKNFFEIGCGTGFVLSGITEAFPHLHTHGSELFIEGLEFAQQRLPNTQLYQMDARSIPFKDEFDIIGAFDVLEHIEEDENVLQQMHEATSKKGGIIITVPQHAFLWSRVDEYACHVRRYSKKDLIHKIKAAGFEITAAISFVSLLFPLMLISRIRKKEPGDFSESMAELHTNYFVNQALKGIMAIEKFLITLGVRFPFGGSLMIIAKKKKYV